MTTFQCAGCGKLYCWHCEASASDDGDVEIKTIGSRYCNGCLAAEAADNGVPVDRMRRIRDARAAIDQRMPWACPCPRGGA